MTPFAGKRCKSSF